MAQVQDLSITVTPFHDMAALDETAGRNFLNQMINLYVLPELKQRGMSAEKFNLRAAQIIFFPDGRRPKVRINNEIKAVAKAKLKAGVSKQKGDPIYEDEVEGLNEVGLTDQDDPDCAHATLVRISDTWFISFDFRYNRAFSLRHIQTAKEFYECAKFSLSKENWSSFIENLFASAELTARAVLLSMPDVRFRKKGTHGSIHLKFNRFARLGNVSTEFQTALNKLSGWRDLARYPKVNKHFTIEHKEARNLLNTVNAMIKDAEKRLTHRISS